MAVTQQDVPVTIDVIANDTDPEGQPLTVTEVTQPANGSATNNGDGTVTYSPNPGFTGTDSFTYTITDGEDGFDTAGVAVEVRGPSPGNRFIFARIVDWECSTTEWHFIITQVRMGITPPATIRVTWDNGESVEVPLSRFASRAAHYLSGRNLDANVVSARAEISNSWEGEFNLSHGPC